MQNFRALLQKLSDGGIDFVIIGGYAAMTHGSSLVTRDLDICAVLTPENVEKLRALFADWNPRHRINPNRPSFLTHPPPGVALNNIYLQTDYGIIDILSNVLGVGDFMRLASQAEMLEVDGRTYRLISLEDLIAAKEAVGREKDLLAAKELRAIAAKRQAG